MSTPTTAAVLLDADGKPIGDRRVVDAVGEAFIPASRRKDGTWRKEIKYDFRQRRLCNSCVQLRHASRAFSPPSSFPCILLVEYGQAIFHLMRLLRTFPEQQG